MTMEDKKYSLETIWLEKGYGTPGAAIAQREAAKTSRYEKRQKRYLEKQHGQPKPAAAPADRSALFLICLLYTSRCV